MLYWLCMEKSKEKIPIPERGDEGKDKDSEYYIIVTKDRGYGPEKERKEVTHYLQRWKKIPDQELGWIPAEEVIEALKKYYSKIDPKEKYPIREAVRRLRREKRKEE